MRAINIQWDTDGDKDALATLPSEVRIPDGSDIESEEDVGDWLSDEYGFCHFGFDLLPEKHVVRITHEMPFLPDGAYWELCWTESPGDARDMAMILYGDADPRRLEHLDGAALPCWTVFSCYPGHQGRCEGNLDQVNARWRESAAQMAMEAGKAHQRWHAGSRAAAPEAGV